MVASVSFGVGDPRTVHETRDVVGRRKGEGIDNPAAPVPVADVGVSVDA